MVSFIFGGNTGETIDSLKQKRLAALALMQQDSAPKNVGEGLAAIGRALSGRFALNYLDKKDAALKSEGNAAFNALLNGGSGSSGSSVPMPGAAAEVSASKVPDLSQNDVYKGFIDTVKGGGVTNPYALSAIAATGQAESGYDPGKVNASWADPSQSGQQGTSGGILSWRNERLANMRNFAQANGEDPKNISPQTQAKFFLQENPQLITALNAAKSPEEAASLMANAWRFAGYDQQGGEAARRLGYTKGFLSNFQPTGEVAAASPATATDAIAAQTGGTDPRINISERAPMPQQGPSPVQTALMQGPQPQAPQLPPPTNVAAPPQVAQAAPMPSPQPQTPQQALSAGPSVQQLIVAAQNPNLSDEQRGVVNLMLKNKMDEQQAVRANALKMSDPAYQADLALKQAQLKDITSPTIKPADQARIDLEKQKLDFEQNGMSKADQEKLKLDRDKFEAEQKKGQWAKLTDGRLYNETTGEFRDAPPPVPGSTPAKFDDVSGIRKEIQQLPSYKNLSQAAPIYNSMVETAGRNTKASDLNLVYGLGKIMDPTSVVREGEMTMVKSTASWPDWLVGAANSLTGGATLQPETRQAILREAFGRVQGYNNEFNQQMGQYTDIAKRNNINVDDIIPKFGEFKPWSPSASGTPASDIPPPPEGIDASDWQYLTPEQRALWK